MGNFVCNVADDVRKASNLAELLGNAGFLMETGQNHELCRPDGAGEWGGAGGYKGFAPDGAANRRDEPAPGVIPFAL